MIRVLLVDDHEVVRKGLRTMLDAQEDLDEGMTNREIGDRIHLAEKTVKNDVPTILAKLQVSRRAEAAAYQ